MSQERTLRLCTGGRGLEGAHEPLLRQWAMQHRLRVKRDVDGTDIVPGKRGHIYEYGPERLGVMVIQDSPHPRFWNAARGKLTAAEMLIVQGADGEGAATFDPTNAAQSQLAIRAVGARRKKTPSPAQRQVLEANRFAKGSAIRRTSGTRMRRRRSSRPPVSQFVFRRP